MSETDVRYPWEPWNYGEFDANTSVMEFVRGNMQVLWDSMRTELQEHDLRGEIGADGSVTVEVPVFGPDPVEDDHWVRCKVKLSALDLMPDDAGGYDDVDALRRLVGRLQRAIAELES